MSVLLVNIKKRCEELGISLIEAERRAGIPERSIYRWDKIVPSVDKVCKLAAALDTTVEALTGPQV